MMNRIECLRILARHVTDEIVVATYSAATDWLEMNDRPLNYFAFGAMGLASSHGLGLALGRPSPRDYGEMYSPPRRTAFRAALRAIPTPTR